MIDKIDLTYINIYDIIGHSQKLAGEIMTTVINYLQEFNIVSVAVRIIIAVIFGGLIGIERGKHGRAAGMRTHILVCLGATLTSMIGFYVNQVLGITTDPMRIAAQVVSGISFLGAGTILLKGRFQITGLTTAACVWATAAVGLALGTGFYEGAILTFAAIYFTVTILHKLEYKLGKHQKTFGMYVEINSDKEIRRMINHLETNYRSSGFQVTPPRTGITGNIGIEANISNTKRQTTSSKISEELEALDYVVFAIESI